MKESKEKVEKAVIKIAENFNMEDAVTLLLLNIGLYSTIKEIVFRIFVENYNDYFEKDNDTFDAIQLVRKYCIEMSLYGEVNFDNK